MCIQQSVVDLVSELLKCLRVIRRSQYLEIPTSAVYNVGRRQGKFTERHLHENVAEQLEIERMNGRGTSEYFLSMSESSGGDVSNM